MRDDRNTTQNGVPREAPTRINGVPAGDEPRDKYHAGFVSWTVTKTSIVMPAESRKGGVVNYILEYIRLRPSVEIS